MKTDTQFELRFPNQRFQSESGLHQNWMREYDPTTGRYLQADPLGLVDGPSVYGYARQNPGRYVDPRGTQTYPSPPTSIPGGPWEPSGSGQRPGSYYGPKQSSGGPRPFCQYVPSEATGGPRNATKPYWKVSTPNQRGWQYYDLDGNPTAPEKTHHRPRIPRINPAFPLILFFDPSEMMNCPFEFTCERS